jgi:hypothetical protein
VIANATILRVELFMMLLERWIPEPVYRQTLTGIWLSFVAKAAQYERITYHHRTEWLCFWRRQVQLREDVSPVLSGDTHSRPIVGSNTTAERFARSFKQ